jgi:hypothetical protein
MSTGFLLPPYAVTQRVVNNQPSVVSTTTSPTFVDVEATKCAVTVVTTGGDLEVTWCCSAADTTSISKVWGVALAIDGAAEVAVFGQTSPSVGIGTVFTLVYCWTGLAAGSHTVKARWQIASGDTLTVGGRSYMTAIEYRR